MAAGGHLGMTALSRLTLASAGISCYDYVLSGVVVSLVFNIRVALRCTEGDDQGAEILGHHWMESSY